MEIITSSLASLRAHAVTDQNGFLCNSVAKVADWECEVIAVGIFIVTSTVTVVVVVAAVIVVTVIVVAVVVVVVVVVVMVSLLS